MPSLSATGSSNVVNRITGTRLPRCRNALSAPTPRTARHANIGKHSVDLVSRERIEKRIPAVRLDDNLDPSQRFKERLEAMPNQSLVVRKRDSQHARLDSGSAARRMQPRGARRSSETAPCQDSSNRSRVLVTHSPSEAAVTDTRCRYPRRSRQAAPRIGTA